MRKVSKLMHKRTRKDKLGVYLTSKLNEYLQKRHLLLQLFYNTQF